jgi:hypothetical protein
LELIVKLIETIPVDTAGVDVDEVIDDEVLGEVPDEGEACGKRIFRGDLLMLVEFDEREDVECDTLSAIASGL